MMDWREGYDWRRTLNGWVYPIKFIKVEAACRDAKGNWYSELATIEFVQAGGRWRCVIDSAVK